MGEPRQDAGAPLRAARIIELRRAAQLTQPELAHRAGVSISTVARAERGDDTVGPRMVARIAAALSVEPGEIFDGSIATRAEQPVSSARAEEMHDEVVTRLDDLKASVDLL